MEKNLPPGFRFHPTNEELITYYLTRKVFDLGFAAKAIADVDLNKCEPWDLPAKASMGEKECYFFSLKDRKYPTGLRTNRATDAGYWKTTGNDKEIFHGGELVGMKKTLVFYKGRAPKGGRTSWVMHEYRMQTKFPCKPSKEEWVVCRVFKKSPNGKKPLLINTSALPSPLSSQCNTALVTDLGELDVSILNNMVCPSVSFNSLQTNETSRNNSRIDMNLYMNWMMTRATTSQPILSWPASLSGTSLISGNPNVQKELPYNGYRAADDMYSSLNSLIRQGDYSFHASSSKAMDTVQRPQQQQHEHESIIWQGF